MHRKCVTFSIGVISQCSSLKLKVPGIVSDRIVRVLEISKLPLAMTGFYLCITFSFYRYHQMPMAMIKVLTWKFNIL